MRERAFVRSARANIVNHVLLTIETVSSATKVRSSFGSVAVRFGTTREGRSSPANPTFKSPAPLSSTRTFSADDDMVDESSTVLLLSLRCVRSASIRNVNPTTFCSKRNTISYMSIDRYMCVCVHLYIAAAKYRVGQITTWLIFLRGCHACSNDERPPCFSGGSFREGSRIDIKFFGFQTAI